MKRRRYFEGLLLALSVACVLWQWSAGAEPGASLAYIGPGAGFAFIGSFLAMLSGVLLALLSLVTWPVRLLWRTFRLRNVLRRARTKRIIFLGLDGLDPRVTERLMSEGKLPNLQRLSQQGGYSRLRTTLPALSPVAWSTFATGVNPGKHNIFDFLNRNLKSYVPELSSSKVGKPSRVLKLGKLRIPFSTAHVQQKRKSTTFWKILGDHGISSTVIRVPITFPPEKFNGRLLSAMCTPDLRGTQGTFSHFTTRALPEQYDQGSHWSLESAGEDYAGWLEGPPDTTHETQSALRIPFSLKSVKADTAWLHIQDQKLELRRGISSPWIPLRFRSAVGVNVCGIVRFLLTGTDRGIDLYATPINIDPEKPALPISHPSIYSVYLAKLIGSYATVGMAEDTWALNEGVIDEQAFLDQAYSIFEERRRMFLSAIERSRRGVVACVFDTSDRVQHMFHRQADGDAASKFKHVIDDLYVRMDQLVGETMRTVTGSTTLFVLSDHGFCSFARGVDLNAWLRDEGYLVLKNGARECGPYFEGVDWAQTRAYTIGLAGVYLNLKGREACGIVAQHESAALIHEIRDRLAKVTDPATGRAAVREVYATRTAYSGPYTGAAPDLMVGYNDGFRTAWNAAVGRVGAEVFTDNDKAWSGDHCVDPALVPGVLFSNRRFECVDPGIEDLAATALDLFGVKPPSWMDGKPLIPAHADVPN